VESFAEVVRTATGRAGAEAEPYPWQLAVADNGLPEVIAVETGAGKTEGVVLPWLWRRRFHPDPQVRHATPHWLVLCLPLRVLTEQVETSVREWLRRLGLSDSVLVHVAMGGRDDGRGDAWRQHPERDAVVIGTVDMLLSRALNRGYAMSRFNWPIDFGLLHNGCAWVFDEVQLLGPALPTSRQLDAFRSQIGTALGCSTTWMSATVDEGAMNTVDRPFTGTGVVRLGPEDHRGTLARRLDATRRVEKVSIEDPKRRAWALAQRLLAAHRAGSLTVAVLNTVAAAKELYRELTRDSGEVPVTLLHSRFRPPERRLAIDAALGDVPGVGRIIVSTQVLEAGVDLSATTMLIEAAPWPSVVQRAGRCNRDGLADDARLMWVEPARPAPYRQEDVAAAVAALVGLEGSEVTASMLGDAKVSVEPAIHPVLRRSDLLGLFDTAPDLSGNDVDVAPFIRAPEDSIDVHVAWRDLGAQAPGPDDSRPQRDELCPVPGTELKGLMERTALWRFDHLAGAWDRIRQADLRSGLVLLADSHAGGYDLELGWDATSKVLVPVLTPDHDRASLDDPEESVGAESGTFAPGVWIGLRRHLDDVENAVVTILDTLGTEGLPPGSAQAAAVAGRLHDIGKAHDVFQDTMVRCADPSRRDSVIARAPWAKSGGSGRARHKRKYFRHELASALALLDAGAVVLNDTEDPALVVYLVAAHHGRVRLGIRSVAEELRAGTVLGIQEGDRLPAVEVPGGTVPASMLSLAVMRLGREADGGPSWSERALAVLDQLGPFRLAFLEAVVRLADWRASAEEALEEGEL
jgi:CRISPR-associated endonuclease/helicase Cas3